MKHVGIFEAKTHLSSLLVEKGGEITITRHGKPVAKLVQAGVEVSSEEVEKRRAALGRLRAMAKRRGANFTHEEIKSWIEDGRH
jgi:antitoxin (DNA-binding transcriptional repressor) of toxin-antitoxin stability system